MKIDMSELDIKTILNTFQKVDPTGMFLGTLAKSIIVQANEQLKPTSILPKEDADMISKLENDIKKEAFQPSSFQGTRG